VQDGLPFLIALGIIKETRICSICAIVSRKISKHFDDKHKKKDYTKNSTLKYEGIILRPGNGHYEINLVRSIFSNFFDIYICGLVKLLGFKTPASLQYIRSAVDHHKSWMIIQV
jgi:hypothetical protein